MVSSYLISDVNYRFSICVDFYHQHRMLLGVAEGVSELVPEKALPFEFNLDYMNGGTYVIATHVRAETITHFIKS